MDIKIRPLNIETDVHAIHEIRLQPDVIKFILSVPCEEIDELRAALYSLSAHSHMFVAEAVCENGERKVVGLVILSLDKRKLRNHSGTLGIFVHSEYHSNNVGTLLLKTALDYADNNLMLVRIDLVVVPTNFHAIALYEKYGFMKEGLLRKTCVGEKGYTDDFIMARISDY